MDLGVPFEVIDADEFDALEIAVAAAESSSISACERSRLPTSFPRSLHASCTDTDSPPKRTILNACSSLAAQSELALVSRLCHSQSEVSIGAARDWQVSVDSPAAADEGRDNFEGDHENGYANCEVYRKISEGRTLLGGADRSEKESNGGRILKNVTMEEEGGHQGASNVNALGSDHLVGKNGAVPYWDSIEKSFKSPCSSSSGYTDKAQEATPYSHDGTSSKHYSSRRLPCWESCASPHLSKRARKPLLTTIAKPISSANEEPDLTPPSHSPSKQCDDYNKLPWGFAPSTRRAMPKRKLPRFQFNGQIIYSVTVPDAENAARDLLKLVEAKKAALGQALPLGFDTEWKVIYKRGAEQRKVAVLQLCVDSYHCNIFHIIHTGIPSPLRTILEDPSILKVGVGAYGDAAKLFAHYKVKVKGVKDLSGLTNLKLASTACGTRSWSLASLIEELFGKQLDKNGSIRMGDWEVEVLSDPQLQYAAADAFASLYLFQVLSTFPDPQKEVSPAHDCNL